ncbi:MAG: hypothetical protein P8L72_04720 [Flavobacteriaceae bacterium]|jgi:phosphomannomutase|nr:hypothetical protein [Flavobacteriaceae bacterium]MDG2314665.1 hypothetical protein [Flavobacteriaceae bacterium]
MKKQLEAQLMSLAHQILRRKDKADTQELKELAKSAFESLSVLHFTEQHFGEDDSKLTQEAVFTQLNNQQETSVQENKELSSQPKLEDVLLEEPSIPTFEKQETEKITPQGIQIDNNHRLTFVNHLFSGSQEDYLRVLSMLNTKESTAQALEFIETVVKPDYDNWENKEVYESQFIKLITHHFES